MRAPVWSAVPEFLVQILKDAGKVASDSNTNVFVVGGFVRDLLLGGSNLDLDLVAVGHGIAFTKALGKQLNAKVLVHEKFGTATVFLSNELKIDVATARKEHYPHPAA